MKYLFLFLFLLSANVLADNKVESNQKVVVNTKDVFVLPNDIKESSDIVKITYLFIHNLKFSKSDLLFLIPSVGIPMYIVFMYLFVSSTNTQIVENKFGLITYHKKIKIREIDNMTREMIGIGCFILCCIWVGLLMFV